MFQLFETIKCNNGKLFNIEWHNRRFNNARKTCFNIENEIDLNKTVSIPENAKSGLFRCRITYSKNIDKIEFIPHQFREIKNLKLVEDNSIDYRFKYSNRKTLDNLFAKRGNCDDILIIKNGLVTDTSTANIIFYDGKKWWTPDSPLLRGTQRAKLLSEKKIFKCRITLDNLNKFEKIGLINAMWDFDIMPVIDIIRIKKH
jgi:4-amino-4-deoxychorismate lyase